MCPGGSNAYDKLSYRLKETVSLRVSAWLMDGRISKLIGKRKGKESKPVLLQVIRVSIILFLHDSDLHAWFLRTSLLGLHTHAIQTQRYISYCMPSSHFSTSSRARAAPVSQPPPRPARPSSSKTGNPLFLLGGFALIGAGGLYFFQKIAYSRGTVLQPGQEKKSKEYRQY